MQKRISCLNYIIYGVKAWINKIKNDVNSFYGTGLVVNLYIPHNRRTILQAEEVIGPISIRQGSRGIDPF
jgi:hypothetical protein